MLYMLVLMVSVISGYVLSVFVSGCFVMLLEVCIVLNFGDLLIDMWIIKFMVSSMVFVRNGRC